MDYACGPRALEPLFARRVAFHAAPTASLGSSAIVQRNNYGTHTMKSRRIGMTHLEVLVVLAITVVAMILILGIARISSKSIGPRRGAGGPGLLQPARPFALQGGRMCRFPGTASRTDSGRVSASTPAGLAHWSLRSSPGTPAPRSQRSPNPGGAPVSRRFQQ